MTEKEKYILDNIGRITVQVQHPYRGSGFRRIYFSIKREENEDYDLLSQRVAARLYNKEIIIHDKIISGDCVMLGTHSLKINPNASQLT